MSSRGHALVLLLLLLMMVLMLLLLLGHCSLVQSQRATMKLAVSILCVICYYRSFVFFYLLRETSTFFHRPRRRAPIKCHCQLPNFSLLFLVTSSLLVCVDYAPAFSLIVRARRTALGFDVDDLYTGSKWFTKFLPVILERPLCL